jgi:hypothetical protein
MNPQDLAPVYVDDERVALHQDPRPRVSKVVEAAGRKPDQVRVVRLADRNDREGRPLHMSDVIDRIEAPENPVFLKCTELFSKPALEAEGSGVVVGGPAPEAVDPSAQQRPLAPGPPAGLPPPVPGQMNGVPGGSRMRSRVLVPAADRDESNEDDFRD